MGISGILIILSIILLMVGVYIWVKHASSVIYLLHKTGLIYNAIEIIPKDESKKPIITRFRIDKELGYYAYLYPGTWSGKICLRYGGNCVSINERPLTNIKAWRWAK